MISMVAEGRAADLPSGWLSDVGAEARKAGVSASIGDALMASICMDSERSAMGAVGAANRMAAGTDASGSRVEPEPSRV